MTFTGDTQEFSAKVSSVRKVDWESLRPNFFFIFPAGALDGQPQSWLTSFRWDNGPAMLTQLNRGVSHRQSAGYRRHPASGRPGALPGQAGRWR